MVGGDTRRDTPPGLLLAWSRWVNAPEMGTGAGDAGGPLPRQHPTPTAPTSLTSATLLKTGVFGVPRGCRRQSPLPLGAAWEGKGKKKKRGESHRGWCGLSRKSLGMQAREHLELLYCSRSLVASCFDGGERE